MAPLGTDLYPAREQMGAKLWNASDNHKQFIAVHTTESTGGNTAVIKYLEDTRRGSYQVMIDFDGEEVRLVPDNRQAWAAAAQGNARGLHLCVMGRAEWNRERWLQEGKLLERAAQRIATWSREYGIPLVKISASDARRDVRGVLGHIDISEAWGESDHWDPGHHFPYREVFARAAEILGAPIETEGDDMALSDADVQRIAAAVWGMTVPKPDGTAEQAGILVGWIDQHAGNALDQLCGPGTRHQRTGNGPKGIGALRPTGWNQLKGEDDAPKSLVDGLASLLRKVAGK